MAASAAASDVFACSISSHCVARGRMHPSTTIPTILLQLVPAALCKDSRNRLKESFANDGRIEEESEEGKTGKFQFLSLSQRNARTRNEVNLFLFPRYLLAIRSGSSAHLLLRTNEYDCSDHYYYYYYLYKI